MKFVAQMKSLPSRSRNDGMDLSSSFVALWWPRAHLRNLLGGEPPLDLPQASGWLALGAIAAVSTIVSSALSDE